MDPDRKALTLKYTDAILKTIATSASIVLTTLFGWLFLSARIDVPIVVGVGITVMCGPPISGC